MTESHIAQEPPEPPRIRALRRLVTALTLTMMGGIIVIVGLLVWRLTPSPNGPMLPASIPLPAGETLTGYAQNPDWIVLITTDATGTQRLHLVTPGTTDIHQTTVIER
jgi:uncharacterized protein DUF6476